MQALAQLSDASKTYDSDGAPAVAHVSIEVARGESVAIMGPSASGKSTLPAPDGAAAQARLSSRERELITLVARGRTDAQIAAELYITTRTVSSHLDRVRDKTGCRRRADLTRLALSAGLV